MCSKGSPPAPVSTPPAPAAPPPAAPAAAPTPNQPLGAESGDQAALAAQKTGATAFRQKRNFVPGDVGPPMVGSGLNIPT